MEVYQATLSDLKEVSNLFNLYRMFYKQPSDLNGVELFISERLKNQESVIFVTVDQGEYLGFTQLYPSFSSVSMKRTWILNDLYVHEEARRKGVAQKLLEKAKEYALSTGAKSLELQTAPDNNDAQRLYEKNGYKVDSSFLNYALNLVQS
ncbi:GNAT family N-acetyltransferase [Peribacillus cavernae]|uniref:GNAT family N-acetyltransferase n=1 Tax=Peribacillus cavernae TaxID=1674310 RepID=A0A3S0TSI5_9BACI|nr:GNAT family N-acetyltransferase [Peribacillus cavernae]MDQ0219822.1 ribosomal protein S18 acetylase RimI-like enzyme [Peribacillus cavernae]RUQ27213.1 GNAT family N-acetyltransferase [Peribacillus cavernae]